jgi:hypothetical protein
MQWNGFSGAPGYTNLHFELGTTPTTTQLNDTLTKVRTFFNAIAPYMPTGVNITYPFIFEQFDAATGELAQTFPVTSPAPTSGASTGNYASSTGACMTWSTGSIVNGRRLRGRTFLVPMGTAGFASDGTLSAALVTAANTAAATLIASTSGLALNIWARPDPGAANGVIGAVTAGNMADRAAVLRSRRD